jgi:bifunctional DNA-binding transcriptional regulator/antitoxin component of YhaV-PrlF toxin-antitoxin module
MPHFETRMGDDGKLVVPEDVQTAFKLTPGDIIDFYLDETARTARIRARNPTAQWADVDQGWTKRSASISRKTTSG